MTNQALHDAETAAQDKAHELQEKASELQHDARERASELRDHATDVARDTAIDAQGKAQWQTTKALRRAERTPDFVYLGAVFASMAVSMMLLMRKRRSMSLFVGLWPVTILNIAMMLKNRRVSEEITRIPSVVDVRDELLAE